MTTITKHVATAPNSRIEFTSAEALSLFLSEHPDYSDGGTVTENLPTETTRQPREVASWKVKYVLKQMGLIDDVEAAINSLPEPNKGLATDAWKDSSTIDRWSVTVAFVQSRLNLSDIQVDGIFTEAENLPI